MGRRARVTFQTKVWMGEHEGYSIVTSAELWVDKGRALTPETLGGRKADYTALPFLFYEVLVESIVVDRVGFSYRNLVIENPNGTINLSAPNSGRFILRPGGSMALATPIMDGGISVTVTLGEIR
ncbi:MAG TPA: hypothetical protein VGG72_16495 [Bryobacteraceae bacterium]|jgi:hypothetical protein